MTPTCLTEDRDFTSLGATIFGTVAVTLVTLRYVYIWWRSSTERLVVTMITSKPAGRVLLPSPPKLLPNWFGVVSGHMLLLDEAELGHQFQGWADKYGGDYELRLLGRRCIVVTGLAEIRRILTLRPSKFKRGLTETQLTWTGEQLGMDKGMFFSEGKDWGRSRRLIAPSLNGHNIMAMLSSIATVTDRLCVKLGERADSGQMADVKDTLARFAHDVVARTAFGLKTDAVSKDEGAPSPTYDAVNNLANSIMVMIMNPWRKLGWMFMPKLLPWVRRAKQQAAYMQNIVQEVIDSARQEMDKGKDVRPGDDAHLSPAVVSGKGTTASVGWVEGDLIRKVIGSTAEGGGRAVERNGKSVTGRDAGIDSRMTLSDEHVLQEVKSLFVAGTDTTSAVLSWALYYLCKHPEVHARCRREALQVAPESEGLVSTPEQLADLVYCKLVLTETLRLTPAATMQYLHSAEEYTMKTGLVAEKGTSFILLTRRNCLSEENFTRARDFVPERWIEAEREDALLGKGNSENSHGSSAVNHVADESIPFGAGSRACPGQDLAKAEGVMAIAAICARFDLSLAPGQPDPPREVERFISVPDEVKLIFTWRKA